MSEIYCVVDRSGSMANCIDDTLGGFNTFLREQNQENKISLYLFDNEYTTVWEDQFIKDVPLLDKKLYRPRGGTALLDAIGKTLVNISGTSPTIVILTDGHENSSQIYTKQAIKEMIEKKKSLGWSFVFLAANQDAIETGSSMGIDPEASLTFDTRNVREAFTCVSSAVNRHQSEPTTQISFTQMERMSSCPTKP
jgi:Mg-chelatase subunit ChlD